MIDTKITRNLRTIDDWKEYFKRRIPEINPDWTNTSDEDLGMVLVTLISIIGDQLNFRYDTSILESFIGSVRERSNLQGLLNLIGYTLSSYQTSNVLVTIKYPEESTAPYSEPYVIPRFCSVFKGTNSDVKYYNLDAATIPAGALGVQLRFYEGTHVTDYKTSREVDPYGRLYLTPTLNNVASNAVVVTYNENVIFTRVDDIYLSVNAQEYELLVDTYGNYYIQFDASWKDYINQNIPVEIRIDYLATSGLSAQIQKNYLDTIDGASGPAAVEIINESAATGYLDPETIENARIEAPKYARTMKTAVTTSDYEDLIVTASDEYLDAKAVDLTYNGIPTNFIDFDDCKLATITAANVQNADPERNVEVTCVSYVFGIMNEIRQSDINDPVILAALKTKYEDSGIIPNGYTVESIFALMAQNDFLAVFEIIMTAIVDITNNNVPPNPVTTWESGKSYVATNTVVYDDLAYNCVTAHTSGGFSTDLNVNEYWELVSNANEYSTLLDILGQTLTDFFEGVNLLYMQNLIDYVENQNAEQNILNLEPYELLLVVLTSTYTLTQVQKSIISKIIDDVKLATIQYTIQEPEIVNADIYLTIVVTSPAGNNNNVITSVNTLISQFFETLMIGDGFRLSQLMAYIHNNYELSGLSYILPSNTGGSTTPSIDCNRLQIVRNGMNINSVTSIEVTNV